MVNGSISPRRLGCTHHRFGKELSLHDCCRLGIEEECHQNPAVCCSVEIEASNERMLREWKQRTLGSENWSGSRVVLASNARRSRMMVDCHNGMGWHTKCTWTRRIRKVTTSCRGKEEQKAAHNCPTPSRALARLHVHSRVPPAKKATEKAKNHGDMHV